MSYQKIKNRINIYSGKNLRQLKEDLSEVVINKISKISNEMKKLLSEKVFLESILQNGSLKAKQIAEKNLDEIKDLINFFKT